MELFDKSFYGNSVKEWLIAVGILLLVYIVLRTLKGLIYRRILKLSKKTATDLDDLTAELIRRISSVFLLFISVYIASMILALPEIFKSVVEKLIVIILLIQGAIWGNGIISFFTQRYKNQKMESDAASVTTFTALGFVGRIILWSIILLLALDNLGVDITTLVAGLGVGGIAVALAVQNILGDLFASLSIVLDKPFVIGDFIIIDNYLGSVEHIGLKTTRIRSLSGEQLIFANSDLLKSRIRNYKRMLQRRVLFGLGVVYQTPQEKLAAIPEMIKEIIESRENVRFDRAHFKEYGNFSLNFEVVYWVQSSDYNVYMDIQQEINLELFRRFKEEGIEFAYPTQTLFVNNETTLQPAENRLKV